MNRSYFSSSIIDFLALDKEQILGALTSSEHVFDITPKVIFAWQNEIDLMKKVLSNYSGFIHFEWVIPRMGKRVDVLLVIKNIIFIIEFKVGSDSYDISSVTQTTDYALDMKNFHEGTHQRIVCPVLVATEAIEINNVEEASLRAGMYQAVAPYRQLYVIQIIRFLSELLIALQYTSMELNNEDIPFFGRIFGGFCNADSYIRTRKIWDRI